MEWTLFSFLGFVSFFRAVLVLRIVVEDYCLFIRLGGLGFFILVFGVFVNIAFDLGCRGSGFCVF